MKNTKIGAPIGAITISTSILRWSRSLLLLIAMLLLFCISDSSLAAGPGQRPTATWDVNPVSNDWNTAANWTPTIVPNGEDNTAKFDFSTVTQVATSEFTVVHNVV